MSLVAQYFRSETLGLSTSMRVVLPDVEPGPEGYATLYLLHGLTDDDTAWTRYSEIERLASARNLAVVMPQVHRSYYSDEAHGNRYWTFLTEEVPVVAHRTFHLATHRSRRFVAGLSMGGYGAIKWALRRPDEFCAVASLSGALGLAQRTQPGAGSLDHRLWDHIFDGQTIVGTDNDALELVRRVADQANVPELFVSCGTEDALLDENLRFVNAAEAAGLPIKSTFTPGGHDWDYWNESIRAVLDWLPMSVPGGTPSDHL